MSEPGEQLSLDDELRIAANGRTFGEWVEELPIGENLDPICAKFPGQECRWPPSCRRDGCWRAECEQTGTSLFGIGRGAS